MKYLISLFLAVSLLGVLLLSVVSCAPTDDPEDDPVHDPSEGGTSDAGIYIPPFKEYADRNAVSFSDISYHTPSCDAFLTEIASVTQAILENTLTPEEQIAAVKGLSDGYDDITTMTSYAYLLLKRDITSETAAAEYTALANFRPRMMQSIECLLVAAANSPHAARLASDAFATDLTPYLTGVKYTDTTVDAMLRETSLETEYLLLSEATVLVEYDGMTDTVKAHIDRAAAKYGETSKDYLAAKAECLILYRTALQKQKSCLFTELVKVRREIADALGATSYASLLYEKYGYSYTQEQMSDLLSEIVTTVVPVYRRLYDDVFLFREEATRSVTQELHKTVNRLAAIYTQEGGILSDAYAFMLQYGLYDIGTASDGRAAAGTLLHFDAYDSPFLFLTADERVTDYLTLASSFGEYLGLYRYGKEQTELSALYGAGCELLTLRLLASQVSDEIYTDLLYSALQSVMLDLINGSFYAAAEARIYALDADEITEDALNAIVAEVAAEFGLSAEIDSVIYLLNEDTVFSPMTAQSDVLSLLPAVGLYYEEAEKPGVGMSKYASLFSEDAPITSLPEAIAKLELSDPFTAGTTKALVSDIFYEIYGADYYEAVGFYVP